MRRRAHALVGGIALTLVAPAATADGGSRRAVHLTAASVLTVVSAGFTPAPAELTPERLPRGAWEAVSLPYAPVSRRTQLEVDAAGQDATVETWIRIAVPDEARGPGPRVLYLPRWKSDGTLAIYGDGRLLYRSHSNLMWNGYNRPLCIYLEDSGAALRELVVRLQHLRGGGGGALSSLWIAPEDELHFSYLVRDALQAQIPAMGAAAFLALGAFALAVWVWRRGEPLYLLFAAMAGSSWIRTLHYHVGVERLPVSDEVFGWLSVNSLFWFVAATHAFLERVHEHRQARLSAILYATTALSSAITLPFPGFPDAALTAPVSYVALLVAGSAALGSDLWRSWQVRSRNGVLLSAWSVIGLSFGLHDWLLQNNLIDIEGMFIAPYAGMGAFFLFSYVMFRRYVDAMAAVERAHDELEARLRQREIELTASLRRLSEIEQRALLGRERERMMQDMHDGLGSSLRTALWAAERGQLDDAALAEVLKDCISDLKLAIDSMETVDPDLLLLLATWRFRLEPRLQGTGLRLRWEVGDLPPVPWLDPKSALHILRILQETLTNVIKHARASEVRVSTGVEGQGVFVRLDDDGAGFEPSLARGKGKGLENQQRRAEAIGATLQLQSSPRGTSVCLWLPLKRALVTRIGDAETGAAR